MKTRFLKRLLVLLVVFSMVSGSTNLGLLVSYATEEDMQEPEQEENKTRAARASAFVGTFSEKKIHSSIYSKTLGWKGRVFHWSIDGTPGVCLAKGVKTPANGVEMIRTEEAVDTRIRKALSWYETTAKNETDTMIVQFYTWAVQAGKDPAKVIEEAIVDYYTKEELPYEWAMTHLKIALFAINRAKPANGYVYKLPGYQDIYVDTPGHPPVEEPEIPPEIPEVISPEVLLLQRDVSAEYVIDVHKSCSETGEGLADAVFDVLENGVVIGQMTTNSDGYGSFTATKTSQFEAYYCPNFSGLTPEQQAGLSEMAGGSTVYQNEAEAQNYLNQKAQEFQSVSYTYTVAEHTARYGYSKHGVHPQDADIPEKTIAGGGSVSFDIEDHRTEGRIVVEKEDLETGKEPQGDATLEGAVYGLFAASPIVHPDGHTGIVYATNELTATATTDSTGRLVFDTHTEGSWKGKSLLMGDYYIKEITRSEGYELSVSGINYPNTNYGAGDVNITAMGGVVQPSAVYQAEFDTADRDLYFHVDKTEAENGYTADINGVPEGSSLYAVSYHEEQRSEEVLTGYVYVQKTDESGAPVFETATGVEFKLDTEGNPIPIVDGEGHPVLDADGNPMFVCYAEGEQMPVLEPQAQYETVTHTLTVEDRAAVETAYKDGVLTFEGQAGDGREKYVLVLPDGSSAAELKKNILIKTRTKLDMNDNDGAGTYIKMITLSYPGQNQAQQDGGTEEKPVIVQERVIKQNIKIYKYISEDYENNSWGVTVTNKLPGFFFKVYLISDLEATGKMLKEADGTYDYEEFFEENPEYADSLAIACDKAEQDKDGDETTVHASCNANESFWYATTRPLPYGRYVIVEQQPISMPVKQYETAAPQEITLPFIPQKGADDKQTPSEDYFTNGRYDAALVPWSVVEPGAVIINGTPAIQEEDFDKFVGYAYKEFENRLYSSKLRIDKTDSETGENIVHDGAYFKIYKAKRDGETGDVLMQGGKIIYDEKDLIVQYDDTGAEVGIFKAFSTIRELTTEDGIVKENVGYIETYEPLGAGTYVLVEISAPAGYVKSEPTAIEIYSDKVEYYTETAGRKTTAVVEQYAVPLTNEVRDIASVEVKNKPIEGAIHKVEAGGERISYFVPGTKKDLENRTDIIRYVTEPVSGMIIGGIAIHTYDNWSNHGTEENPRYDIYVGEAELTLYEALPVTVDENGQPENIIYEDSKAILTVTGEHTEIRKVGERDNGKEKINEYDAVQVPNDPAEILTNEDGVVCVQDKEGNTYVYPVDENGNKIIYSAWTTPAAELKEPHLMSRIPAGAYILEETVVPYEDGYIRAEPMAIQIEEEDDVQAFFMENDFTKLSISKVDLTGRQEIPGATLTLYEAERVSDASEKGYHLEKGEIYESWISTTEPHWIDHIPVGDYILEETLPPYEAGYVKAEDIEIEVTETGAVQSYTMEDDHTILEIAKTDLVTGKPVEGATLSLYKAVQKTDGGYRKGDVVATWQTTSEKYRLEYIPVGTYILEETITPEDYLTAEDVIVTIEDIGGSIKIQQAVMYDKPKKTPPEEPKPTEPQTPTPEEPTHEEPTVPAENIVESPPTGDSGTVFYITMTGLLALLAFLFMAARMERRKE